MGFVACESDSIGILTSIFPHFQFIQREEPIQSVSQSINLHFPGHPPLPNISSSLGAIPNATLAVLDSETGKVLEEHGKGQFFMPHGLTIDAEGNHWLTDVGSHQVHKLDSKFKPLMTLGEKMVPG